MRDKHDRIVLALIGAWVAICLCAYAWTFTDSFAQAVHSKTEAQP